MPPHHLEEWLPATAVMKGFEDVAELRCCADIQLPPQLTLADNYAPNPSFRIPRELTTYTVAVIKPQEQPEFWLPTKNCNCPSTNSMKRR